MSAPRREVTVAVAVSALGAGLALLASPQVWVQAQAVAGTGVGRVLLSASGTELAPAVSGLGLVGLAGSVAVIAVGGWARLATGVLLAGAGAGIVASCVTVTADLTGALSGQSKLPAGATLALGSASASAWPWLALLGGVLLGMAGLLVTARGRRWPGMSRRYEAPGAPTPAVGSDPRTAWEALDRGEDPTD